MNRKFIQITQAYIKCFKNIILFDKLSGMEPVMYVRT